MKTAIIGSRGIVAADIAQYIPDGTTEIVSGGAKGVDTLAKEYAQANELAYTEFRPDYKRFGRGAPLKRNEEIVTYSDCVVALHDGTSRGTQYVIDYAAKIGKPCTVYVLPVNSAQ
jgi:predicted Rossmann fold nucleotide-binding protein DprA/Smf involved in DNA uptake